MVDPIRPANDPTKIRIAYPPTQDKPDDAGDSPEEIGRAHV